jgi:hypothetical protein
MRKVGVIFLTLLYTVSTSGVGVGNFYCCGKFKETFLFSPFNADKGCKQNKKMRNCCDTKIVLIKVADSHAPSSSRINQCNDTVKQIVPFSVQLFNLSSISIGRTVFAFSNDVSPPIAPALYLSHCVFRI